MECCTTDRKREREKDREKEEERERERERENLPGANDRDTGRDQYAWQCFEQSGTATGTGTQHHRINHVNVL